MKRKKGVKIFIALFTVIFIAAFACLVGFLCSQRLSVDEFLIISDIDEELRLCHISDLHVPYQGVKLAAIISECKNLSPDLFLLTGDIFDGKAKCEDLKSVADFLYELRKLAPVYAVPGNHEIGSPLLAEYKTLCLNNGIALLINRSENINIKGVDILITGLNDGNLFSEKNLPSFFQDKENSDSQISLLLAHRPELIDSYAQGEFTAVFSGHAHGGQARIFGVGLYAPDQGVFPSYTSGRYVFDDTEMFVSRGLGDGYSKFRMFNSYNINLVTVAPNA